MLLIPALKRKRLYESLSLRPAWSTEASFRTSRATQRNLGSGRKNKVYCIPDVVAYTFNLNTTKAVAGGVL